MDRTADTGARRPLGGGDEYRLIGGIERSILMRALDTRSPGAAADSNGESDAR